MDVRLIIIEIAEKLGLIATAGLVSVLVPPLRNRLLGVGGQPRDRFAALVLGILLAMWGAKMGQHWLGIHVNVHAVGVMMAAILGGGRVGLVTGFLAGLFYVYRVEPSLGLLGVAASTFEGALVGFLVEKKPGWVSGWRTFGVAFSIELTRAILVGIGLGFMGESLAAYVAGWPALLVQMASVAFGIAIFVVTTRIVLAREDAAVALVGARAAADHLALEALRRRLEPHFLFNALNTLRATIRVNPPLARELVNDLSDLYRYLLNHPEDAPLESEVDHACNYLAIEKARLGEGRLEVETDVPKSVKDARVPALLLQPLVENAVKHGVGAHDGKGTVTISASREGDALVIDVVNVSSGEHVGVLRAGSGIALKTLRERLSKRFPSGASIELLPVEAGMCARVTLPWDDVTKGEQDTRSAA
ncbi:MAG: histidine kinase [Myxococcota bacterium]